MKNDRFIGRERELSTLESMHNEDSFQMLILYGRRRVGKSRLIREFLKDKRSIYYMAVETDVADNLRSFSEIVFRSLMLGDTAPEFRSFEDAFSFIVANMGEERLTIVIDEFPYLAMADKSILSVMQRIIDTVLGGQNIFLILCGSSIRFMEEDVLGEKSPLFGRRTAAMDLKPFDYMDSANFVSDYSYEQKAIVYGVTGGVAKYLEQFNEKESLDSNLKRLFFSEAGYMVDEPINLLRQEFRNISTYMSIIGSMANGAVKMHEISQKTGAQTAALSKSLSNLSAVRIISKFIPILNEKSKNQSGYIIEDSMFSFWYRFVLPGRDAIALAHGDVFYDIQVKPYLHDFMGAVFEKMCRAYTLEKGLTGQLDTLLTSVGKWAGADKLKKTPADIDVVGINKASREAVIGECKFKNKKLSTEDAKTCVDRIRLIEPYDVKSILLFSLGGFSKGVPEVDPRVTTVSMEELYR
ncbi:MAG: ATP-binding protein [Eubacterium sp.]|nr:ATP-binding protein [Eubacterium sp.]